VEKIENFFHAITNYTIQYIIMETKRFNSKGQLIEELEPPLEKVEPNIIIPSALSSAEPFLKVDENEILAWCEYYLHSKKIERKLSHIKF
jgi:hypothetical protein